MRCKIRCQYLYALSIIQIWIVLCRKPMITSSFPEVSNHFFSDRSNVKNYIINTGQLNTSIQYLHIFVSVLPRNIFLKPCSACLAIVRFSFSHWVFSSQTGKRGKRLTIVLLFDISFLWSLTSFHYYIRITITVKFLCEQKILISSPQLILRKLYMQVTYSIVRYGTFHSFFHDETDTKSCAGNTLDLYSAFIKLPFNFLSNIFGLFLVFLLKTS